METEGTARAATSWVTAGMVTFFIGSLFQEFG
jgi:hypothetical protein